MMYAPPPRPVDAMSPPPGVDDVVISSDDPPPPPPLDDATRSTMGGGRRVEGMKSRHVDARHVGIERVIPCYLYLSARYCYLIFCKLRDRECYDTPEQKRWP